MLEIRNHKLIVCFLVVCFISSAYMLLSVKDRLKSEVIQFNIKLNSKDYNLDIITENYLEKEHESRSINVLKNGDVRNFSTDKMLIIEQGSINVTVDKVDQVVYYTLDDTKGRFQGEIDTAAMFGNATAVKILGHSHKSERKYEVEDQNNPLTKIQLIFSDHVGLKNMKIFYDKSLNTIDSTILSYNFLDTEKQIVMPSEIISRDKKGNVSLTANYSDFQLIQNTKH